MQKSVEGGALCTLPEREKLVAEMGMEQGSSWQQHGGRRREGRPVP
jgi:hypothetical protein